MSDQDRDPSNPYAPQNHVNNPTDPIEGAHPDA